MSNETSIFEHIFSASLALMAFLLAIVGLLIPEYLEVRLDELKSAYFWLICGATLSGTLSAISAGLSLLALYGVCISRKLVGILLGIVIIFVAIGLPVFTYYSIFYLK